MYKLTQPLFGSLAICLVQEQDTDFHSNNIKMSFTDKCVEKLLPRAKGKKQIQFLLNLKNCKLLTGASQELKKEKTHPSRQNESLQLRMIQSNSNDNQDSQNIRCD